MRLFCLEQSYKVGDLIPLDKDQSHRILNVLRMRVGTQFQARDAVRNCYCVTLVEAQKNKATLSVMSMTPYTSAECEIILWQAIPKHQHFEEVITLAIEAGVTRIVPMITEYTQVNAIRMHEKSARWARLAQEAIDQSGNNNFLEVMRVHKLQDLLEQHKASLGLFAHQEVLSHHSMIKVLKDKPPAQPIVLAVGPEGGFSPNELHAFAQKDFHSIFLNGSILRSEHAAVFFLGAIKMLLQERL